MQIEDFPAWTPNSYSSPQSGLVVAGAGILGEFTIHTPWGNGVATLFDTLVFSASALVIGNITYPSSVASIGPSAPMCCNVKFKQGLYLQTLGSGGVIFISYRIGN